MRRPRTRRPGNSGGLCKSRGSPSGRFGLGGVSRTLRAWAKRVSAEARTSECNSRPLPPPRIRAPAPLGRRRPPAPGLRRRPPAPGRRSLPKRPHRSFSPKAHPRTARGGTLRRGVHEASPSLRSPFCSPLRSLLCSPLRSPFCRPLRSLLCSPLRSPLCAPLSSPLCGPLSSARFAVHFVRSCTPLLWLVPSSRTASARSRLSAGWFPVHFVHSQTSSHSLRSLPVHGLRPLARCVRSLGQRFARAGWLVGFQFGFASA